MTTRAAADVITELMRTEKGTKAAAQRKYFFLVSPRANKQEVRRSVEELFKVTVAAVNTMNVRGKARRQKTKQAGVSPAWKKAVVALKKGEKIVLT